MGPGLRTPANTFFRISQLPHIRHALPIAPSEVSLTDCHNRPQCEQKQGEEWVARLRRSEYTCAECKTRQALRAHMLVIGNEVKCSCGAERVLGLGLVHIPKPPESKAGRDT